jgi:hypothetical protein
MDRFRRFLNSWADLHLLFEALAVALLVIGSLGLFK